MNTDFVKSCLHFVEFKFAFLENSILHRKNQVCVSKESSLRRKNQIAVNRGSIVHNGLTTNKCKC